jgi:fructuronate reductase
MTSVGAPAARGGDVRGPDRLSLATLRHVRGGTGPLVDPRELDVGIVHLGLGAFHRAHQALFTEDAIAAGGGAWGICGVTLRSRRVVDQLEPQDGMYTVLTRSSDATTARVAGVVREVRFAGERPVQVVARLAEPAVRVTTLTVTEKGYRHDPATGRLRHDDEGVRADVAGAAPRTVVGLLARGLQERMRADAGPLAVVCCDNLAHNGATLSTLVREFVDLLPAAESRPLAAWIGAHVSFPNTMVDRIVPATTAADRADAAAFVGLADEGTVVTEPFRQWVIEDDFRGARPAWEQAGALLTRDVAPYEVMKLRMLNASHSTLAYLGALAGYGTIAEAMCEDAFAELVDRLMREDVQPTLEAPDAFDLDAYRQELLRRFANRGLRHRTEQVAMDGSQKLPQRLLPTLRERRTAGVEPRWAAFALAAWMRWVWTERRDDGCPRDLDDPLAAQLTRAIGGASSAADVVDRLLGVREMFGEDLAEDEVVRTLLVDAVEQLARHGAIAATRGWVSQSCREEQG